MRTGHYTRLKGRVTYFRRKVPEFLQERLASTEICYRLGVISSGVAERLGRRLAVEVDTFFSRAKTDLMLDAASLTKLVETALKGWREDDALEAANDIQAYGRPIQAPREQAGAWAELAYGLIAQVGNGHSAYDDGFVHDIAKQAGVTNLQEINNSGIGGRALSLGLAAHYLQSAVNLASMHGLGTGRGALDVDGWHTRLAALETHLGLGVVPKNGRSDAAAHQRSPSAPSSIVTSTVSVTPPTVVDALGEPTTADLPFSEFVALCLRTRIANKEVKAGLATEMKSSLRIWIEVAGDRPIKTYGRQDFLQYRSTLQKVPKYYWKSDTSRALSIHEVIDWARADARAEWTKTAPLDKQSDVVALERAASSYEKVSNTTINRHLSTISPVFDWAVANHHLPEDIRRFWENLHLPTGIKITGLKPNEERPAYTPTQIKLIATHPVWLGRRSAWFYNEPGNVIIRDSLYWGFPIALLHGMRREELSQLTVGHIRQIDGIWVFDLHAIDVDVKLGASRRYVPIHSQLLALGFLDALVVGRNPNERLFVELTVEDELDDFGDALG